MAAPVLTEEQRIKVIEWLAAGYPEPLIAQCFAARGWKMVTHQALSWHREQHREEIEARKRERESRAYDAGLAQLEERVRQLVKHAETLEELKWLPDEKGKLHNEKAWRETLDDIAKELGHRRAGIDLELARKSDEELIATAAAIVRGVDSPLASPGTESELQPLPE